MKLNRLVICFVILPAAFAPGTRTALGEHQVPAESPFTAEVSPLTLAELEAIALGNNPTLVQAAMRVRAARGKYIQAGLYPNPFVGYRGEEMGVERTAGQQGGIVGQQIVTAGKLRLRSAVAGHEVHQAEHAQQAQQQRVLNDVRTGRYETLAAQQIAELNGQLVQIAQKGVDTAKLRLAALDVSRVDVLQAQIEADSARLQLYQANNRHLSAWRRLTAVLGVPEMEPAPLAPELENDLPGQTWDEALQRLLAQSPELAEARCAVRRARCEVARQCAERIPNLDVRAALLHHNPEKTTVAGIEFGVPLPIFNRNQGNIYKAQAQLIASENEVRRLGLALQERLAAAFARYATARHNAQQYADSLLPNAGDSLKLIQTGYEQGEFDQVRLLTAQRTYHRVNLAYLESLLEYRSSSTAIDGFLLSGGLEPVAR